MSATGNVADSRQEDFHQSEGLDSEWVSWDRWWPKPATGCLRGRSGSRFSRSEAVVPEMELEFIVKSSGAG